MIKIITALVILLCFSNVAIGDLDFLNDHDYIHINSTCLISNTPQTIEIPIYNGVNLISIPIYPDDSSLDGIFSNIVVNGDIIKRYVNNVSIDPPGLPQGYHVAEYYTGYGWWEWETVAPIEPKVGYEYSRMGCNCTLIVNGTYLLKDNFCDIYIYFNLKNIIGTNIIRPLKSDIYD